MLFSIVSPVYMAQNIVPILVEKISLAIGSITEDYEIILVEDGSADKSWTAIEEAAKLNKHVKGIKLSRNFGQHFAITAGLTNAKGDFVVVMDCDLQDDPVYIPQLYQKILEGYDIVYTEKEKREHNFIKNVLAEIFFSTFNFLVDDHIAKGSRHVGAYSMLSKKVVTAFLSLNEYGKQYLAVLNWLGFNNCTLKIEHRKRYEGKSTYSFIKMTKLALDAIVSQSDKLLRLMVAVGLTLSVIAFISIIYIIISYLISPFAHGWASIAVLIIFVGGITMLSIGICGLYIGKTYEQTKNRPAFIVDKTT